MSTCVRPVEFKTLFGRFQPDAGTATIYPSLRLISTLQIPQPYALVGLQLSSSLVIYGANFGGFFIVIGQTLAQLSVSQALNSPMSHITQPNSLTGPPAVAIPTSKVTSLSFGQFAYPLPAQTPISLYAFADATAGNDLFAVCSLQLARMK